MGVLLIAAIAALADPPGRRDDNGFLLNLLQNRISAPGREIRLSGVTGALSSRAKIAAITVSDDAGAWLTIENAEIDWSRLALLRGRVSISRLSAERIAFLRRAEPPALGPGERLPEPEAEPFALPELPVAIRLDSLEIGSVTFDPAVFGQAAELSVAGRLDLVRGALDTALTIDRLDGPGGVLDLDAAFSNASRRLDIDLRLQEPAGGVVASLLRIEGRPAIELTLTGAGPLDEVDVEMALDAGGARIAGGRVALRAREEGLGFDADLSAGLAPLIPAPYRDFFAGQTELRLAGVNKRAGGLLVETLTLRGAELSLDGGLETAPDGFLRNLTLSGRLGDANGPPVVLPVPGADTTLQAATVHLDYGAANRWSGLAVLDRLAAGGIEVEDLTLTLGGLAQNLDDPAQRNVTINAEGLATGIRADDPRIAAALGTRIDLFADVALPPAAPIAVRQLQISGNGLSVFTAGTIENFVYSGRNAVRIGDIAAFSDLAGRSLSGAVDFSANGSISPLGGGFDLTLDGTATDLRLDDPRLDGLLAGETQLDGRVVRDEAGIRTEGLRLANAQLEFASDGRISSADTDFGFDARIVDLAAVDPRLAGALTATGRATGSGGPVAVTLTAAAPAAKLLGRDLSGASVSFAGAVSGPGVSGVSGRISGEAALDTEPIALGAEIEVAGERRAVRDLALVVGPNRLAGAASQTGGAPIEGRFTLDAPDVAPLAALALTEATGAVEAEIALMPAEVGQGITLTGSVRDLTVAGNAVAALDVDARVADALGVPLLQGTLDAQGVSVGGVAIDTLSARADQPDADTMRVTAAARLAIGTEADVAGELRRVPGGFEARIETLNLRQQAVGARLTQPATVALRDGMLQLTPVVLDVGAGRLTAAGSVGERFDIDVALRDLPLDAANAVQPGLGFGGTINGTARVTGPRAAPDVAFDVRAAEVVSTPTEQAGLPPIAVTATGTTAAGRLNIAAEVASRNGLAARARGSVPLGPLGPGALDVALDLEAFPLVLVDRLAGRRGLAGTITGTGRVTGPLREPAVAFDLRGTGVTATPLRDNGVPPLTVTAQGSFARSALTLAAASVAGERGLSLRGAGKVPLRGPGLDVTIAGDVPLALANTVLADRDAQATGLLRVNARLGGSLAAPNYGGTVALSGGTLVDPLTNIRLEDATLDASLDGTDATIRTFQARVAAGGRVSAAGRVSLDGRRGFPADLTARLDNVRYTDGTFVTTRLSGDLAVRGPLQGGGEISGSIDLGVTEISVAEGLGANAQAVLEQVIHVLPPSRVSVTLQRARVGLPGTERSSSTRPLTLNVRIRAPNKIFVRGRGLDVELGGELALRGSATDLQPVGQFDLRRGRLVVLGQRITFDEGRLQLIGNLDPQIFFIARTQSDDITAIVTVAGRVSAPEITFSSEPQLPQDEVLARVIFRRSAQDLSAFQLAQLAAAAAELAGGGGPGFLSQLRGATGLDELDIVTEDDGSTAVRAGKYIDDNIYLDLQAGTDGTTRAQINLDLSDRLTARGSVATDGNTTLGLFYERDY